MRYRLEPQQLTAIFAVMQQTDAEIDAEMMRDQILLHLADLVAKHGRPTWPLKIARYPTADDHRYMRGSDPWSWEHHMAVVLQLPSLLLARGVEARLVDCTAIGCMAWLDSRGLVNNQSGRAAYTASVTSG